MLKTKIAETKRKKKKSKLDVIGILSILIPCKNFQYFFFFFSGIWNPNILIQNSFASRGAVYQCEGYFKGNTHCRETYLRGRIIFRTKLLSAVSVKVRISSSRRKDRMLNSKNIIALKKNCKPHFLTKKKLNQRVLH